MITILISIRLLFQRYKRNTFLKRSSRTDKSEVFWTWKIVHDWQKKVINKSNAQCHFMFLLIPQIVTWPSGDRFNCQYCRIGTDGTQWIYYNRSNIWRVPTRCRLNVGTVPMRCRLNVGTVPTFKLFLYIYKKDPDLQKLVVGATYIFLPF